MIAKPFIERFKQSSKAAMKKNTGTDYDKFLPLFQLTNNTPSNDSAPKILAEGLFRAFNFSDIIISKDINKSLKVERIWHNPVSSDDRTISELQGKPASILCESVKSLKQQQFATEIGDLYPTDPILTKLSATTYIGFPLFNDNNDVTTVISMISNQAKTYSKLELDLLTSIVQRINRELEPSKATNKETENNASNSQLKAELDAANKSLESLSYAISHDLRAPLRSMDSFSQLLVEDYTSELPDEAINYLGRIRRSAKRMGEMIEGLLWLAKVTRRKLEKQQIDLSKTAENVLSDIIDKHSEYKCDFHSDPHMIINADKNLIKIALQHLLSNACKFSQHNETIEIHLSHFEENGETIYKLKDNGCGFDMTYYDQLFEPFKKLHDGKEYKGTGIGLATIKRIVQRHGGQVWAESEIDEGTSVFFTLGPENI